MTLAERKIIELKQKLRSLSLEFEMWRASSQSLRPLEKHHTQIRRITNQLDGYQEIIQEKLKTAAGNDDEVLGQAIHLEMQILELHRIWEFFRSKLVLRSVEWFNPYLVAADEFAWACYRVAKEKADPQYVAAAAIKEPPLVFFNGGWSPFTMPRKFEYQAEEVPEEGLKTPEFFELLKELPIPVIGIPWFQIQHLPEGLVIGHEVGHIVRQDFGLEARTLELLNDGMRGRVPDERQKAWREWLDEIFADVYGTLAGGPAFVESLIDFLAAGKNDITQEKRSQWDLYPTVYLRVLLTLEVLVKLGFEEEELDLRNNWTAMFPEHAMSEFAEDVKVVVGSLLVGPYPQFGNVALTEVLKFTKANQLRTTDTARSILSNGPFAKGADVRDLYAAARCAFARDAGSYERQNIQALILKEILRLRKTGKRRRGTTNIKDACDKEAGRKLFDKLEALLKI